MRRRTAGLALGPALALALACAGTDSRIAESEDVFDSYPEEVQQKIRAGEIAVGFSEEQVLMALGEPDRRTQVTAEDAAAEVWTWRRSVPGVGIGSGSRRGRVGIGTGVTLGEGARSEDEMVVELVNGRVTRFEQVIED